MQLFNNYVMLLVLASKGYSVISPVVDEEKMRSGQWLGLMLYGFLQCFDTDSWVTGRHLARKNLVPLILRGSLPEQMEEDPIGNR